MQSVLPQVGQGSFFSSQVWLHGDDAGQTIGITEACEGEGIEAMGGVGTAKLAVAVHNIAAQRVIAVFFI